MSLTDVSNADEILARQSRVAEETYLAVWRAAVRPEELLSVWAWADRYRMLSSKASAAPGRWQTSKTPYLREPMDCLSYGSAYQYVVLMFGAQLGKTETCNNLIGHRIHRNPGPIMVVQPTTSTVKRYSKQRIAPLLEDTPVLRGLVKPAGKRDSGNTTLMKDFPGGVLVLAGANSASDLRSMPARDLIMDEVDAYPVDVDGEGEPTALAEARTRTYKGIRKILVTSTPNDEKTSRVWHYYQRGDQRRYWVPCPRCSEFLVLERGLLRWDRGSPSGAWVECPHCLRRIDNHEKQKMLAAGSWRPDTAGDGVTASFHLSSMASPVGWMDWGDIARQSEAAGDDPTKKKTIVNTIDGRPNSDSIESPDHQRLYERRESYPMGVVPGQACVLTAGVDIQARRIECEIVGWNEKLESWSVLYQVLDGDTNQADVWNRLREVLDLEYETEIGARLPVEVACIDSGYNTDSVYSFVRGQSRFLAVKGSHSSPGLVGSPTAVDLGPDGKKLHRGVRLWSVNVSRAKEDLYRDLQLPVPDLETNQPYPAGFLHFPQYGVEFFEQLCAERQVLRRGSDGFTTRAWEKTRERNEALDCRVYAIAARVIRGIDRWRPEDWAARRKAILDQVRAMKINESHPSEIPKIMQQGHERKVRFRQSQ